MSLTTLILFFVGLGLLVYGADLLVRGASRLALALKVSPLVVGLTVVAYGTSSPEFAVSAVSALKGNADIAVGNVVGSNIFNNLVVLGLSALIAPLVIARQLLRLDVPILIGVSLATWLFGLDGRISRIEGLALVVGAVAYTIFLVRLSRKENLALAAEAAEAGEMLDGAGAPARPAQILLQLLFVVLGLAMLTLGSRWLVDGAIAIARLAGLSELVIGLTIVAAGTSLPEVAASMAAAIKKEREIAVGNVVGSSIFNLLFVLGAASAVSPAGVAVTAAAIQLDMPVMIATAALFIPVFLRGFTLDRWEGGLFLLYYCGYAAFLILQGQEGNGARILSTVMLYGVLPATGLALLLSLVLHYWRKRPRSH